MADFKDSDLLEVFIALRQLASTKYWFLHYLYPVHLSLYYWMIIIFDLSKNDWENLSGADFFIIFKLIFKIYN